MVAMHPKEVHCVCPFLKEKFMSRAEFLTLSKSGYSAESGVNFENIGADRVVELLSHTCKNRLNKVDDFPVDGGTIIYLSGDAVGEKAYYLLTAVVKEHEGLAQVFLRANSDKDYGLTGFLNETLDNLRHLVVAGKVREIGVIRKEQVINIIDSVVQRTSFGGSDGSASSINIKDSVVQRTEFNAVDEEKKKREEEERLQREEEDRQRKDRDEQERIKREKENKEREEQQRREAEERKEREKKDKEKQELLKKQKEEQERQRKEEQERKRRQREEEGIARREKERLEREELEKQARRKREEEIKLQQSQKGSSGKKKDSANIEMYREQASQLLYGKGKIFKDDRDKLDMLRVCYDLTKEQQKQINDELLDEYSMMKIKCSNCFKINNNDKEFCIVCGAQLP